MLEGALSLGCLRGEEPRQSVPGALEELLPSEIS